MKKKIYIDFDGVLNNYAGWKGSADLFEPLLGSNKFLYSLSTIFEVYIFTTRNTMLVTEWLIKHNLRIYVSGVTNVKEPAYAYVDDRAVKFDGDYEKVIKELAELKVWWK